MRGWRLRIRKRDRHCRRRSDIGASGWILRERAGALPGKPACTRRRFSLLRGYEPAFEPLPEFLRRNSPERSRERFSQPDLCVIRIEHGRNNTELAPGSLLMIEAAAYPAAGDLTLFGTADGRILLREFHPEGEQILFHPVLAGGGRELCWKRAEEPGFIRWIHPVREIVLKMHR